MAITDGRSVAQRVSEFEEDPPRIVPEDEELSEDEELFVLEQGRRVTVSQLVRRGTPIEYRMNLNSKSIQGGGDMGLLAYTDPDILLVVPARQGKVVHDPTFDEDGIVQKVVIRVNFKPLAIYEAASREGRALLEGE